MFQNFCGSLVRLKCKQTPRLSTLQSPLLSGSAASPPQSNAAERSPLHSRHTTANASEPTCTRAYPHWGLDVQTHSQTNRPHPLPPAHGRPKGRHAAAVSPALESRELAAAHVSSLKRLCKIFHEQVEAWMRAAVHASTCSEQPPAAGRAYPRPSQPLEHTTVTREFRGMHRLSTAALPGSLSGCPWPSELSKCS